jgi:hypothetical protein
MPTEIPSPSDIRKINDLDLLDEKYQADWLEYAMKTVASFLTENSFKLQAGELVRYEFPGTIFVNNNKDRTPNRYERLWSKRYPEIVALLIDKGYFCEVDDFELPVNLLISLEEHIWTIDAPERKHPTREQKTDEEMSAKERPWWKFW